MPLKLKTKQDRQLWQFLNPDQRVFAKQGKCLNLTVDYLPEDILTRFVFVFIKEAMNEFEVKEHLGMKLLFENYITLHYILKRMFLKLLNIPQKILLNLLIFLLR